MASKSLGTLTLDLVAKTGGFVAGMDKAARESEKWKRKVKRNIDDATKAFARLSAVGVAGLVAGFSAVAAASARQEDAIKQVETRLKSTGGSAGRTSEQIQALAGTMQNLTTFGDEAVLEMQSMLLTFTDIRGEVYDRTVPAILDLSVAMNQDLKSSVVQLGKALNDPIANLSALSRTGIQFSEDQKKLIRSLVETGRKAEAQTVILGELERQFGGSAEAAAETFSGALAQVKNAFGDLLENPGGLEDNVESLQELRDFLSDPETKQAALDFTQALIDGFTLIAEGLRTTIGLAQFLGEEFAAITAGAASDDIVRLEDQLELAKSVLENPSTRLRFFGPGGIVEYYNEEEVRAEIAKLEAAISAERDRLADLYTKRPIITPDAIVPPGAAAEALDPIVVALEKIDVFARYKKPSEYMQSLIDSTEDYQDLVKELRTDEEKYTDQLRERLKVINDVKTASQESKSETRSRALAGAFEGAPGVEGLAPEVGGALGEIQRLNEAADEIDQWYADQLDTLRQYRDEKLIVEQEYNEQEQALKQEHEDAIAQIEKGRQLASYVAAEELFGNLSGLAKQFAGEQSDAYKILFAAEKAAAIARSIVAIQTAIAQASASAPFPANLAAMASVAAATAGLISTITSTTISGQAHDGLMSVPTTGTYILEKGERVTTAETSAKLDKTLSDVQGGGAGGKNIRIVTSFDAGEVVGGFMGSDSGEELIMNVVRRNSRTIKSLAV